MTKPAKTIIAVAAAAAVLAAVALVVLLGPAKADKTRRNVLTSAQYYLDKGDYGRALDLVDKLLIDNAFDKEARDLRDKAMQAKSGEDAAKAREAAQAEASGQKAIAQSLDKLGQKLKTGASAAASTQGAAADASAKSKAAQAAAAAAAADAQKKADADAAAAQKKAEAEAEAARKKAEADELAKKGRELQDKMRAVNELVDKGKKSVDSGDFASGDKAFAEARGKLPEGEDKFSGQKLADMADALYSAAKKNPGAGADAAMQEAIQTARDAKKRDPANALPFYTLGKINSDLNQTDNAITELKQAASLDLRTTCIPSPSASHISRRGATRTRVSPSRLPSPSTRNSTAASTTWAAPGRPSATPPRPSIPSARRRPPTRTTAGPGRRSARYRPSRATGRQPSTPTPRPYSSSLATPRR